MKFEIGLIRDETVQVTREDGRWPDTQSVRKGLREITDSLEDALLKDSLSSVCESVAFTMLTVAKTSYAFNLEPEVIDLVEAARRLLIETRADVDRGLMIHSEETTRTGLVMMEIVCRGIFAAIGINYPKVMRHVAADLVINNIDEFKLKDEDETH